jgi:transposase
MNNDIFFISNLFNVEPELIESASLSKRNGESIFDVRLNSFPSPCPSCGNENVKIKGYVTKKINHSILCNQKTSLIYHARRYVCPVCGKTYYERNPFVFKKMKISSEVVLSILSDLTNPSETFSSVANRYNLSPTTIASIFDTHVDIPRACLPRILSIDENYAFHSDDIGSKYICVFIDQRTGRPIDILPSRRFDYLDNYFKNVPKYEKNQVEIISTDMYEPYRRIIKKHFKHSLHVVDRYHVAQELHRKVDAVRLRIQNEYRNINKKYRTKEQEDAYYLLKYQHHLMFRHYTLAKGKDKKRLFDIERKRYFNQHFKQYMNPYDLAKKLVSIHPDLEKAWELKDEVNDFYRTNTIDTAEEALNALMEKLRNSGIEELEHFAKTMFNWRKEIINSFTTSKAVYVVSNTTGKVHVDRKRVNNALIENSNGVIKLLTKAANGYTNWPRFRNRCMLILEKDIGFEIDKKDGDVKLVEKKKPDK